MGWIEDAARPAGRVGRAAATTLGAGLVAAGTAGTGWWLLSLVPPALAGSATGPAGPLLAVAAALAAVVCGRLCLSALACAGYGVAALAGSAGCRPGGAACTRLALAASPKVLRPVVAVLLASGITVSTVGAAGAASTSQAPRPALAAASVPTPDVGTARAQLPDPAWSAAVADTGRVPEVLAQPVTPTWTPARPAAPARRQPDVTVVAAPALRGDDPAPVVVRRGDTLWAIAARHLGPGASDADIAEQWPLWWRANRTTIGDDPDLLLPGQVLTVPASRTTR